MSSLGQHLYEYKRGVRKLVLHTANARRRDHIEGRLRREGISFFIIGISKSKINVFFGDSACVDIVRDIGKPRLVDYTAEEDFLLGTMLGYDLIKQCDRYLKKKKENYTKTNGACVA